MTTKTNNCKTPRVACGLTRRDFLAGSSRRTSAAPRREGSVLETLSARRLRQRTPGRETQRKSMIG